MLLQGDQIIVLQRQLSHGEDWEFRIDTGEKVILDLRRLYLLIFNSGKLEQGVQVMEKGQADTPDYPILSASDYFFMGCKTALRQKRRGMTGRDTPTVRSCGNMWLQ